MPKDTFLNLSEEKKKKIINAAKKEFSRVPLEEASIKNIVEEAEIARGSFYQYFESKEDLLKYIIMQDTESKNKEIADLLKETDGDIFELCIFLYDKMTKKIEKDENMIVFRKIFNNIMQSKEKRVLENNLIDFKMICKIIKSNNLKIQNEKELEILLKMLIDITFKSIMYSKMNENKKEEREKFLKRLEFIKFGVMENI